ncbi:Tetratricopeptide-like helical domain containing protein [Trema orientale]|uniref:Tetratricopeptide-like helical domain containing protein n=1 Tax=Trema orientale TaxID=63057 RepID=A0A2P5E7U6_TREOI|nr:Tetratricopeptide-like helical domain containing protein [Trema orientale]
MSFRGDILKDQTRLLHKLHRCSRSRSLRATKLLHAFTITMGCISSQTTFIYNNIVSMYASLGELPVARKLFDHMPRRTVVSYNTVISAYSRFGYVEEAWEMFSEMRGTCGYDPTQFTFGGLLSCETFDTCKGVQLHALVVKNGFFFADAFVGTALLGLYGRKGLLEEAVCVFEDIPCKSLVTWNSMLTLLGHYGLVESSVFLFRELMRAEAALSECSFVGVLSGFSCNQDMDFGEQIHGLVLKLGFDYQVSVVNSLINMYVKCAGICSAEKMFKEVSVRDVVTWNTIIGATSRSERPEGALGHFSKMLAGGVLPNSTTYVGLINCCTSLAIPFLGGWIHAKVIRCAFGFDVFVGSALVDFYAKCDNLEGAYLCFHEIKGRNVVSWNALISGYSNKCPSTSMFLLQEMLQLSYQPNEFSFSTVLKSSLALELQQLHSLIMRMGYQNNEFVLSSLITSYAKNGLISDALAFVTASDSPLLTVPFNISAAIYNRTGQYDETLKLLSLLEQPDSLSWNIVIAACARNNYHEEVFELFKQMNMFDIYPDNYTFVSLLSVCTKRCNLALGSSVHGLIIKTDFNCWDLFVHNILIDMYGKCGNIESSVKIFDSMTNRNLITWTALISALGLNGYAHKALERFREMVLLGFKPDSVALNGVLTACRHGGLVREGMELFRQMKMSYRVQPEMQHYHNVVDLLAKCGHAKEAENIIAGMPFPPNAIIWRSLLECSKRNGTIMDQATNYVDMNTRLIDMLP